MDRAVEEAWVLAEASPSAPDAVLLPTPWYFNHEMTLNMLGVEPRPLSCDPQAGFVPDAETAEALIDLLHEHAVPVGKIFRVADMLVDPQFRARDSIVEVERQDREPIHMQNAFPRLSRTDSRVRWTGPPLGQHTDEVLREAGVAADRLPGLR